MFKYRWNTPLTNILLSSSDIQVGPPYLRNFLFGEPPFTDEGVFCLSLRRQGWVSLSIGAFDPTKDKRNEARENRNSNK